MLSQVYTFLKYILPPSGSLFLKFYGLQSYESVVDIGCGKSSVLRAFNNTHKTGIDAFGDYIEISKAQKIHHNYIQGNITEMDMKELLKSYQAVIAFDLIEHLTQNEAIKLIETIENCQNIKFIAIKTPSSYIDQGEYDGNVFQKHYSSINSAFFRSRNYQIHGVDGPKFLYVSGTKMSSKASLFAGILSILLMPIYSFFPDKSLNYLAILRRK